MSTVPRSHGRSAWAATIVGIAILAIGLGWQFLAGGGVFDLRWVSGVTGLALIVGFTAGWMLGRRSRETPSPTRVREFLVDYHQIRHETFDQHRPFARLRLWAQMSAAGLTDSDQDLESACGEFLAMGLPALQRFTRHAEDLEVAPSCVRTIRDEVERIERRLREALTVTGAPRRETVNGALRHVEVLAAACRSAYDEVAGRTPCRPDLVIEEVVRAKAGAPGLRRVQVSFEADPDARVPVLFDPGALRALIGELMENAGRALLQTPAPEMKLRVAPHGSDPRFVIVTVEDNGPGIGEGMRPAVFLPGGSGREIGGFGLAYARDSARAWLGDLELRNGAERGSVATLRLRVLGFESRPARMMV